MCATLTFVRVVVLHQIAVDNGFGGVYGQQKADWMVDAVQQYFHDNSKLCIEIHCSENEYIVLFREILS